MSAGVMALREHAPHDARWVQPPHPPVGAPWPPWDAAHLLRLTDSTGMVEHALGVVPNPVEGYSLDDNARALILTLRHYRRTQDPRFQELAIRYLSFLLYCQQPDGWFHNDVGYDRHYEDEQGPEDTVGRALWALGETIRLATLDGLWRPAWHSLRRSFAWTTQLVSLRPRAFALLGLLALHEAPPGRLDARIRRRVRVLATRLGREMVEAFRRSTTLADGWEWFEDRLTYCNARLPHGLLAAWRITGRQEFLDVAVRAGEFLWRHLYDGCCLHVVGNRGWWLRGKSPARFDQQPVDAGATVELAAALWEATGDARYAGWARVAQEWFYGRNVLGVALYDPQTGGCRDGLGPDGANENQGAESTLAHLLARLAVDSMPQQLARRVALA